jgi:putative phosphoesterase
LKTARPLRVGLISDTHGLLRPGAAAFLRGSDLIVHAGDVCDPGVLDALRTIAPTTVVRGNNDRGDWADSIRDSELVEVGAIVLYAIHDIAEIDIDPEAAGVRVVVFGHSHRPSAEERGGVLYVNPGSAGPRRFSLPISVAELSVAGLGVTARFVEIERRGHDGPQPLVPGR